MKNISAILNVILAAAVAFLFYKMYNPPKGSNATPIPVGAGGQRIVYVNNDTLYDNFEMFKKLNHAFEEKKDSIQNYLKQRSMSLERDVTRYQQEAQSMTDQQRKEREEQLTNVQQGLVEMRNKILDQLGDEEKLLADSIQKKIDAFISVYSAEKGYTYILGYQRGSLIHYADSAFDITREVLEGLNKQN